MPISQIIELRSPCKPLIPVRHILFLWIGINYTACVSWHGRIGPEQCEGSVERLHGSLLPGR
jgi:hypothetical protein